LVPILVPGKLEPGTSDCRRDDFVNRLVIRLSVLRERIQRRNPLACDQGRKLFVDDFAESVESLQALKLQSPKSGYRGSSLSNLFDGLDF
jgi:hypothetical protein